MKPSLKDLPTSSGVYLFKNKLGKVIYVGKAINLKNRIKSYFQKNLQTEKTRLLVEQIEKLDFIKVESELEALLLEAKLIKKFQPDFNQQLKDDKDYLYILITTEDFPAVISGRKQDLYRAKTYFGPFPSANAARLTLKVVRRILPFRINCRPNSGRTCLSAHLGLCPGVCSGKISKKDYTEIIGRIKRFLNGETKTLISEFESEVKLFSKNLEFEKAQEIQRKIDSIRHIARPMESVERYLTGPDVLTSKYSAQIESLAQILKINKALHRIECYDISNISGTNATGSMVVLIDGQVSKNDYRRFKIKTVKGSNDPAMMSEVLQRRFRNNWPHPDLIILDGGKTQLSAGLKVLKDLGLSTPIISLAKKLEELHIPNQLTTIRLPRNSTALFLVQRIRDEAHRFAIGYHRYLRSKAFINK